MRPTEHRSIGNLAMRWGLITGLLASAITSGAGHCYAETVTVDGIRLGMSPARARVVFDLSSPVDFELLQLDNPTRITVELVNIGDYILPNKLPAWGTPITNVQAAETSDGKMRYTFFLDRDVEVDPFRLNPHEDRGYRLVIDLYSDKKPVGIQATPLAKPVSPPASEGVPSMQLNAETATSPQLNAQPVSRKGAFSSEWSGYVSLDSRLFPESPAYSKQDDQNISVAIRPEFRADWGQRSQRLAFVPFYRYDANDAKRTNADIRELYWQVDHQQLSFKAGIDVVFWGVAESQHLVDIINQTDLVENLDGEEKLGQPMLNVDYMTDLGTWQLYFLPYFRDRTFPGQQGRLRNDPPVDMSGAIYESSDKQEHLDFALRWTHTLGDWDIGLGHFSGTSREAALLPSNANPKLSLVPFYPQIDQTSLDAQATKGAWLWKLEAIYNQNNFNNYYAYVTGFEFTQFGIAGSSGDLGWLLEYHYDERGDLSTDELIPTALQDDLYMGMRWTGNDISGTRLLFGILVDMDTRSTFGNIEYSRRLGELWTLKVEARVLGNIDKNDLFYPIRKDDYIGIGFTRYF